MRRINEVIGGGWENQRLISRKGIEKGKWGSGAGKENTQGQCEIVKRERLVRENYVWEKAEGAGRRCPFPLPCLR